MAATTGTDENGPIEYYFTETTGNPGGSDSGWQTDPFYTDADLDPDTPYTYTVQMRDALNNAGMPSRPESATTQSASNWTVLISEDFESGWGSFTDGVSDCRRSIRDQAYAHQGQYCARISDNSGTASSFYSTSGIDLATPGYTQMKIEFWYYPRSMEQGENFWVQYFDGSSWHTIGNYVSGSDFDNGSFYRVDDINIDKDAPYAFPTNMKIRIMSDASGNSDYVYIDEVVLSAR
jgi:hypothetical protein